MKFNCENLEVYKLSRKLIVEVYSVTKKFPQEEKFGLTSQAQRTSVSIALNLAEGSSKSSKKDFANFVRISIGSLIELDTALKIAIDLEYIDKNDYKSLEKLIKETYFKLIGLHKYLKENGKK